MNSRRLNLTPLGWWALAAIYAGLFGGIWLDGCRGAVEVTPVHDHRFVLYAVTAVAGVIAAIIGFTQSQDSGLQRVMVGLMMFGVIAGLATYWLSSAVAAALDQQADFPPAQTRTFTATLVVGSAHRHFHKGESWDIETAGPTPVTLNITRYDYGFMLNTVGQGPAVALSGNNIAANGAFCIKVTVQTAGAAMRIVHGNRTLPAGTVGLCRGGDDAAAQALSRF